MPWQELATKDDLKNLATKDDLINLSKDLKLWVTETHSKRLQEHSDKYNDLLKQQSDKYDKHLKELSDRFEERMKDLSDVAAVVLGGNFLA